MQGCRKRISVVSLFRLQNKIVLPIEFLPPGSSQAGVVPFSNFAQTQAKKDVLFYAGGRTAAGDRGIELRTVH
ncbi:MAG: hypothetical protein K8F62_04295, partial [Pseudorhodoplanes sp.]|nr:hypothetical protein [Pseudorhodoplanes sp.]